MNKRPLCIAALVYILSICSILIIDTLGIANMPLTLKESVAASLVEDKDTVKISGKIYKQEIKNEKLLLYLKNTYLYQDSNNIKANQIIVYTDQDTQIPNGYNITAIGTAKKFQKASNPGQFNSYLYYKSLNIDFSVVAKDIELNNTKENIITTSLHKIRMRLSYNFNQITKKDSENGTFKALVLGDSSDFTGDIKELYQKGGILHIICISGSHIEIIGMFLFILLRKCKVNFRISGGICIGVVICYGVMTGFGVSAYRAVLMFTIAMIAKLIGRTYDLISSLSLAAIIILLDNPYYIMNLGFLLSFGAVIGIGVVAPIMIKSFQIESKIIKDVISSVSVSIVTLPILLYFYYEFPLYSTFLNLIVIPISSIVLVSGIFGCLMAEICISIGVFMLGIGSYILKLYEWLCRVSLELPYSTIVVGKPSIIQIVLYYIILIIMLYILKKWKKKRSSFLVIPMIIVILFQAPQGFWVTFLDVGQGDGIVIHSQNNITYMIDGGSSNVNEVGKYRILPFLKEKGIKRLDYSFVTHPDKDHTSGIIELIQSGYDIKHLVLPEIENKDEGYLELEQLAKESNIPVIYMKKGNVLREGQLEMKCLHPYKEYTPSSLNDYSLVLSLNYKPLNLLLTGDLESKGEKEVKSLIDGQYYNVLKVAHHGSKNSTSMEFINKLNAKYAIISCGENNRYGHPHTELLERLQKNNMQILSTKDEGAITIYVKNYTMWYSLYGK